jgi:hypothetical protein
MHHDIQPSGIVNGSAYVDFKKTTDALFERVTHEDLADALGVSVALIRQARLKPGTGAHRTPPEGWEKAVAKLAADRERHFCRLLDSLGSG